MMVAKISTEHKVELDRMEDEYTKEIREREQSEKQLRDDLEKMSTKLIDADKQLNEQTSLNSKLNDEINRLFKTHEEEVQLRL